MAARDLYGHMGSSGPFVLPCEVELILEKLGAGETIEQILEAHPRLTREGILAAIRYGVEVLLS